MIRTLIYTAQSGFDWFCHTVVPIIWIILAILGFFSFFLLLPAPNVQALTNHHDYYPHGWQKPSLYSARKIADQMIDFDPTVEGEETRREEVILANDAGRAIRLSHNGRVFCYIVDDDLYDPWLYQIVDHDGSGAFEMKEPPFSDFPLPRWTFINYPFLNTRQAADFTASGNPSVRQLVEALTGQDGRPCIKKYTPEQRAALAVARGGDPPPDECLPNPVSPITGASATDGGPRVALNVLFDFDQDTLTAQARTTLSILGRAMISKELAGSTFRLEGHTDAVGGYAYNMDLSRRRANMVQRYLMEHFNIPSDRLIPAGFGESVPLPNIDPEDGRNRRVEVVNLSAGRTMTMPEQAYQTLPAEPYTRRRR